MNVISQWNSSNSVEFKFSSNAMYGYNTVA